MSDQWYYSHEGNKVGPCSARQLRDLADAGHIQPTDTIWKEGVEQGVVATRVKNLFPPGAEAPPAAERPEEPPAAPEPPPAPAAAEAEAADPAASGILAEVTVPASEAAPPPARRGPPPEPVKKGRALAIKGAIITSQDGTRVHFRKKCTTCGHEDNCRTTLVIQPGLNRTTFFCRKCRKVRPVELQGIT